MDHSLLLDTTLLRVADISLGILSALIVSLGIRAWLRNSSLKKAYLPLPPSPRPFPIIGNLLDLPPADVRAAEWWSRHKALYGPISSVTVFGTTFIIANDEKTALDLLERRSLIYSSRPSMQMAKLSGCDGTTPLLGYGPELRIHRREFQRYIGTQAALARFAKIEETEMHRLLLRTLEEPDKAPQHMRRSAGTIILKIVYGYNTALRERDPLIDIAERASDIFSECLAGGAWVVDVFPLIQHLPAWLPGMTFKKKSEKWRKEIQQFTDTPLEFVQRKLAKGEAHPCFATELIEQGEVDRAMLKWIAATIYGAAADTTVSVFTTFILAMVISPDVQTRAQKEIDEVLGRNKLPSLSDRAEGRLPYVEAVVKETLRWNTVGPMAIPHASTEEDEYAGFRIPKNAVVMMNVWQINHDPDLHKDPFSFKPERFMGSHPEADSWQYSFGLGRRICAGKDFALQSLYLAISMVLATYNIGTALDKDGQAILPNCEYTVGNISHPKRFAYSMRPRDEHAIALIRSIADGEPSDSGDAGELKSTI